MSEGRTRLCAEDTQYARCEGGTAVSTGSCDVSCGCLWSQEQARSLFFVLHLPFTFPVGFYPTQLFGWSDCVLRLLRTGRHHTGV